MGVHESMVSQQFHQLPMFMSAREIREGWQALDGDRLGGALRRKRFSLTSGESTGSHGSPETDDQLYARKLAEAHDPSRGPGTQSLVEHLRAVGGVSEPIHLLDPTSKRRGALGRPEVLGGHHRIAAMSEIDPDALMPVLFHSGPREAKRGGGYPYT